MSTTLFDTRTMLPALEVVKKPKRFLRDTFFRNVRTFDTEAVDIDIIKDRRRVAPFVTHRQEGPAVDRRSFETRTYKPQALKPKMVTEAEDIMKRSPGEVLYSGGMTATERGAERLMQDLLELDEIISRREEVMCSQALFDDAVQITDVEGNKIVSDISFGRSASHTISDPTTDYSGYWNQSGSDPIDDLRKWRRLVTQDSGVLGNIVLMGAKAVDAFLANADVREVLNLRRSSQADIQMRYDDMGVVYVGNIEGMEIFQYDEWYIDDWTDNTSPVEMPMIPDEKIIVGSTMARMDMLYGAIRHFDSLAAVPRFPYSWTENDPARRIVQLHSTPLPAPHQVDSTVVVDVIGT